MYRTVYRYRDAISQTVMVLNLQLKQGEENEQLKEYIEGLILFLIGGYKEWDREWTAEGYRKFRQVIPDIIREFNYLQWKEEIVDWADRTLAQLNECFPYKQETRHEL